MPLAPPTPYWQTADKFRARLYLGDVLDVLQRLPAGSVQCVITSPPYWGLRDYGTGTWEGGDPACAHKPAPRGARPELLNGRGDGGGLKSWAERDVTAMAKGGCTCGARRVGDRQIGSEPSPTEYVEKLVAIFREVRRLLRDDGTLWLNLGDTYAANGSGSLNGSTLTKGGRQTTASREVHRPKPLPSGNLVGIPWRVAFALQADGWVLRQDIVWHKPSPMPESVTNRCTKAHEYVFLLTKGGRVTSAIWRRLRRRPPTQGITASYEDP